MLNITQITMSPANTILIFTNDTSKILRLLNRLAITTILIIRLVCAHPHIEELMVDVITVRFE